MVHLYSYKYSKLRVAIRIRIRSASPAAVAAPIRTTVAIYSICVNSLNRTWNKEQSIQLLQIYLLYTLNIHSTENSSMHHVNQWFQLPYKFIPMIHQSFSRMSYHCYTLATEYSTRDAPRDGITAPLEMISCRSHAGYHSPGCCLKKYHDRTSTPTGLGPAQCRTRLWWIPLAAGQHPGSSSTHSSMPLARVPRSRFLPSPPDACHHPLPAGMCFG